MSVIEVIRIYGLHIIANMGFLGSFLIYLYLAISLYLSGVSIFHRKIDFYDTPNNLFQLKYENQKLKWKNFRNFKKINLPIILTSNEHILNI